MYSILRGIVLLARPHLLSVFIGFFTAAIVGRRDLLSREAVIFGHNIRSLSSCRGPNIRTAGRLFGLLFFVFPLLAFFTNTISGLNFG